MIDELQVQKLMELSGRDRNDVITALEETSSNITEALSLLMIVKGVLGCPRKKEKDERQKFFTSIRNQMDTLNQSITRGFISPNQSEHSEQDALQTLREETARQNNCSRGCHPPSPELEVQKQETAYLSQSECSFCLQSTDHIQSCSAQVFPQSSPSLEKESSGTASEKAASDP